MDNQPNTQPQPQLPPQPPPQVISPTQPASNPITSEPNPEQPNPNPDSQVSASTPMPPEPQIGGVVVDPTTASQPINPNQSAPGKGKKSRLFLIIGISCAVIILLGGSTFAALKLIGSRSLAECGRVTVTNKTFNKSPFSGCFDQHYANCSPAQIVIDNESILLKGTVNQYDIKSKQGASCLVQWQYVALPLNKSWVGKTITCPYKEAKDFETALDAKTSFTGCTGPLLSAMTSGQNKNTTSGSSSGSTTTVSPGTTQTTTSGSSTESITSSPTTESVTTYSSTGSSTSASQTSQ